MQFQELRQRVIEDEFVFSMYRIQNVISKIIKNIKTKETMNYDNYVFVKTVILKVDDALCKAYQVLKLDEGKNI